MATQTSTAWAFYKAFRTQMRARSAIGADGVVVTAAPSGEPVPAESIQLLGHSLTQAWAAIGNRRIQEQYTVRGGIFVIKRGAGEDVADAARDRVGALVAEIEDELRVRPDAGMGIRLVALFAGTGAECDQGAQDNGRWAAIDFSIAVTAELVSS